MLSNQARKAFGVLSLTLAAFAASGDTAANPTGVVGVTPGRVVGITPGKVVGVTPIRLVGVTPIRMVGVTGVPVVAPTPMRIVPAPTRASRRRPRAVPTAIVPVEVIEDDPSIASDPDVNPVIEEIASAPDLESGQYTVQLGQ